MDGPSRALLVLWLQVGNERAREGASKITASGTFWLTGSPMAAALATLDVLEADDCAAMRHMQAMGTRLTDGLNAQVRPPPFHSPLHLLAHMQAHPL